MDSFGLLKQNTCSETKLPRPSRLDADSVLDSAMALFWARGYGAVSIEDLVAATGASRYALYARYGDKRGLYLAALRRYEEVVVNRLFAAVEAEGAGPSQVRGYLDALDAFTASPQGAWGCLMVGAAQEMAGVDPEVAVVTRRYRERLRAGFERAGDEDPASLAAQVFGRQVLARMGA